MQDNAAVFSCHDGKLCAVDMHCLLYTSYDGFDETEDSTFPNMLIETAKLENYIQKNLGGQLFAAYGCSLGGSFVGLMVQRKKIHIRHGILGSSDLDQGSSFGTWAMAKAMTPLLGKMLRSGKLPVWAKKKMEEKAGAEYAQAMLQLFGCSAATQELPSMAFVSNTSIFNQFFSDIDVYKRQVLVYMEAIKNLLAI